MEIRDQRLYRADYNTFEAYCRERWGWSRQHADRHVAAAKVVDHIEETTPNGVTPTNEAQARPLTKLPEDEQAEAWEGRVRRSPGGAPVPA